jgi:hypothetical protein
VLQERERETERIKEKDAFHAAAKALSASREAARQAAKSNRATWERQMQLQKGREKYVAVYWWWWRGAAFPCEMRSE